MRKVIEGSHAVSEAVRLANVKVVAGYPITPQTHVIEAIADYCENGTMNAKFIPVESEHSAMAVTMGATSYGVRTFTATSSHGLALMHELLHWTSSARLPIVMAQVNRALGPGWNIWADQTDSLSQRDTGWIQLYCEDGQEVFDTILSAFRLAETVNLPVMVNLDAFFISHTYEAIDIPSREEVDGFLPSYSPRFKLDINNPSTLNQLVTPQYYMEMRRSTQLAMEKVPAIFANIEDEYFDTFRRKYGQIEAVDCEDADIIIIMSGSSVGTGREVIDELRSKGEKVGLLKIKMFRPFPVNEVRQILKSAGKVAVIDRNFSFGASGIFAQEIRAAMCGLEKSPHIFGYIAGLGGRDITSDTVEEIYLSTKNQPEPLHESEWIGLNQEIIESCHN